MFVFLILSVQIYIFFGKLFQNQTFAYVTVFYLRYFITGITMAGERVIGDLLIRDGDDDVSRNSDDICLRIDSDTSVEVATERVFVVGYIYILDDLRQLAKSFGLAW